MADVVKDPKSNPTTYGYSSTYAGAYLTSETNALNQTTTFAYDFNTGLVTSSTDPNNQTTRYTYDEMSRIASATYPDLGGFTISHQESTPPFSATLTKKITSSQNYVETAYYDGLGRSFESEIVSDSPSPTYGVSQFDGLGRLATAYNPTRCSPPTTNCGESTWGLASYTYDPLGRTTKVTQPDGSTIQTAYVGNTTTVTDEAGKKRKLTTDGLGRLTQVIEDPSGLNYETDYGNDALDNVTSVTQGGSRSRTFTYDSLSRLTASSNPESGSISYGYDANGNVTTRKDARNITTTYSYDSLNRVLTKGYSDGTTTANFVYDVSAGWSGYTQTNLVGRLSEAWTGVSSPPIAASIFGYDSMGRTTLNTQCTPANCGTSTYAVAYTYNLGGDMTTAANGGFTTTFQISAAERPTAVTSSYVDSNHPATLASSISYAAPGQTASLTYGNGLAGTWVFNNRLQPCRYDTNSSSASLLHCSDALPTGSLLDLTNAFNFGTTDNGNVVSITASGQQHFARTYGYDSLNRLSSMSAPGDTCSGLSWGYDEWGNRTGQTATGGTCPSPQYTYSVANRVSTAGFTYDASGNMTHDASHSYVYDAENRLIQVDGTAGNCATATACFGYDAFGRRTVKVDAAGGIDYVRDLNGRVVAEWDRTSGFTGWGQFYVYLGGQLVADYENDTVYFVHSDHLGSTRLLTTQTKTVFDSMDYLPFGEQIAGASGSTHKFTGKERDSESNLDNFEARYMASSQGRFMSPDPSGLSSADLSNPQSLNLYAYVHNSPLVLTDPTGLGPCDEDNNDPTCTPGEENPFGYPPSDFGFNIEDPQQNGDGKPAPLPPGPPIHSETWHSDTWHSFDPEPDPHAGFCQTSNPFCYLLLGALRMPPSSDPRMVAFKQKTRPYQIPKGGPPTPTPANEPAPILTGQKPWNKMTKAEKLQYLLRIVTSAWDESVHINVIIKLTNDCQDHAITNPGGGSGGCT